MAGADGLDPRTNRLPYTRSREHAESDIHGPEPELCDPSRFSTDVTEGLIHLA